MAVKRVRVKNKTHAWVKWVVALGVVAVLGAVFAASVGIGQWLLRTAEQYPAGEQQELPTVPEEPLIPIGVAPIKAHAYRIGNRYTSFLNAGTMHLCAPLRDGDGSLLYASDICKRVGWDTNGSADLAKNAEELHYNGMYLSTHIPIKGFAEQEAAQRELVLSYEASLIAEAANTGVDEIFLTGLQPTAANVTEIAQYLRRIKALSGDCAIGIMITPEVLLTADYGVYTAAQLMSVCDFLVLDLRNLPLQEQEDGADNQPEQGTEPDQTEQDGVLQDKGMSVAYVMQHMQYDLQRYAPRLALTNEQSDALDYITAQGYANWVILE